MRGLDLSRAYYNEIIKPLIIDTYPSFIEFWDRVRDLPIDTQIEAWHSEYMSQWPELLEKQITEYKNDGLDWKVIAKERIFPLIPGYLDKFKQARDNLLEVANYAYKYASGVFDIDFDVVFVIYVGIGLGAGWATTYDSKPACLFGLENIADLNWSDKETLAPLTAHELGHLIHIKWRENLGLSRGSGSLWNLYEEGLAMRFEHIIMGRETWHEQKGQNEWLEWCYENKSWLASEFLKRVDNNEAVKDFFGTWYNLQGYTQCGYFLGHELIKEMEQDYSIKEISVLPLNEIERLLRKALSKLAQC
jgi:hypothetical protein